MQLVGLHHLTAIVRDMPRTVAFYRDLLGLAVAYDGASDDDPDARHVAFAVGGAYITFLEYPTMEAGVVGAGTTHHFALTVGSEEEQVAWRDYLRAHGVQCTDIYDRGYTQALYLRDPDGHVVEIATAGPGFPAVESPVAETAP